MFKRAVRDAVRTGRVRHEDVAGFTDDAFMQRLIEGAPDGLAAAIRDRRLYKRALDLPASEVPRAEDWPDADPGLLERVEDALAEGVGLAPGELLLDFPGRRDMLAVDLPLRLRDGRIERLTAEGRPGQLGLPRVADELYRSARRLRVFAARPVPMDAARIVELVGWDVDRVGRWLGQPLPRLRLLRPPTRYPPGPRSP